jgi:hypothetical protein
MRSRLVPLVEPQKQYFRRGEAAAGGCNVPWGRRCTRPGCEANRKKGNGEVVKTRVPARVARVLIAGLAALVLSAVLFEYPAHSRAAAGGGTQPSINVAVVPGFAPQPYAGNNGVPALPVSSSQLASYHFAQLPAKQVTSATLSGYDTVLLYGIRWSDISPSGRAAIDSFAATHKVVIWDADATPAQTYSTFVHPFSTLSSGQNYKGKPNDSVVSFPSGLDFLASEKPTSPYYLDPNQLVKDRDEINDMNAMKTGTKNWLPALVAATQEIPHGAWPLAWSYGVIGNHTGLTIYSGIDADAFANRGDHPNNAVQELALDLAAPFRSTPDASCAPNCQLPGSGEGHPFAACSFAKRVPRHWVHGRVKIVLKTSVAAGITGRIVTRSGRTVARGRELSGNLLRLPLRTKKLPSNRISRLRALVLYNGQQACSKRLRLKVDNVPPRLLQLTTTRGAGDLLSLRVSEKSRVKVVSPSVHWRGVISAHRTIHLYFPASLRSAQLILRDRAGNTVLRTLVWG